MDYGSQQGAGEAFDATSSASWLALCRGAIALSHQIIDLLSTLKHTLNGLVENNLGLVKLLLDLEDAVGLLGVLVLGKVVLQLGHGKGGCAAVPAGAGVLGKELVDDLAEKLMRHKGRVLVVGDDDAADTLAIPPKLRFVYTLLLNILSLSGAGALGDGLCE
ncbi:hypothetical protein HG530_010259 [Fusarium avenaceum]|nr:hypothetical protein HG530_010259 [Fusarium avenaceum]